MARLTVGKSANAAAGIFVIVGVLILLVWLAQKLGILQAFRAAAPAAGVAPAPGASTGGGQFGPNSPSPAAVPFETEKSFLIVPPSQPMSAAPSVATYKSTAPISGFPSATREVAFDPRFGLFDTAAINRAAMGPGWIPFNG